MPFFQTYLLSGKCCTSGALDVSGRSILSPFSQTYLLPGRDVVNAAKRTRFAELESGLRLQHKIRTPSPKAVYRFVVESRRELALYTR